MIQINLNKFLNLKILGCQDRAEAEWPENPRGSVKRFLI